MPNPAISVERLSKAYRIGLREEVPDTIVGAVKGVLIAPFRNAKKLRRLNTVSVKDKAVDSEDTLWALKDVSFEVNQGEVIGIIGRNGAGKSTLLKILSRITEPTHGRAVIRGRVSSLLEVGTGFHPELTGRENIYMNGTILGMRKKEIDRKFDEIVDFSGVERFLDTPCKRYSSGMQVRLAFAVAAHLEPEILVIDEVLAVGDAEFQAKCLGKMQDVAKAGRTVLFVSHNMAAVINLCQRGIVLKDGSVSFDGHASKAIEAYSNSFRDDLTEGNLDGFRESWCQKLIQSAKILDGGESFPPTIVLGGSLTVEMEFSSNEIQLRSPVMGLVFHHNSKGVVAGINTRMTGFSAKDTKCRAGVLRCVIPKLPFLQGRYQVDLWLGDGPTDLDVLKQFLCFDIAPTDYYGTGRTPFADMGTVMLDAKWNLEPIAS